MGLYDDPVRYDLIYREFREDIPFYLDAAASVSGPIVDFACGTGRVTIPLAAAYANRTVHGVDLSSAQVELARRRAEDAGLGNLRLHTCRMEAFSPPQPCGLALCSLHSLEHLTEEEQLDRFFLNLTERVLAPGGRFAFALHLPDPGYLSWDPQRLEKLGRYGEEGSGGFTLYERRSYDASSQVLTLNWFFEPLGEGEVEEAGYELRLFYPREIRRILSCYGFEILSHAGWYDGSSLSATSGTQVILAERRYAPTSDCGAPGRSGGSAPPRGESSPSR